MALHDSDLLVVGIDLGMTRTGVAYSWNRRPFKIIQTWPGGPDRLPRARDGKVPTTLMYKEGDTEGGGDLQQWGFGCDFNQPRVEWFKRYLDPQVLQAFQIANPTEAYTSEAIARFYKDFLANLYDHLKWVIRSQDGNWRRAKVEFLFSVPSTFKSPAISEKYLRYIEEAGFGRGGPNHTVEISLTEPEAAAVYTVTESARGYQPNEILIVVDSGGGTTDLCIFEMTGTLEQPSFNEMLPVNGIDIGSTNIDLAFQRLVLDRMQRAGLDVTDNPDWKMINSDEYEVQKCNFGTPGSQTPYISIRVPTLPDDYTNDAFGISRGRMLFTSDDFKSLFDPQIIAIESAIRAHLDTFGRIHSQKQVNHLVLCGGLGSSAYLRTELSQRLITGSPHDRARRMEILVSDDPQLAVMKGLVIDRLKKLETGQPVLRIRRARISYGILSAVPYDPKYHEGEEVVTDPVDGRQYANNMIKWIIKKGDRITPNKLIDLHKWTTAYNPGETVRIKSDQIVISHAEEYELPESLLDSGVEHLCEITSDFSRVRDRELKAAYKPRTWHQLRGELYYLLEYDVKVLLGPADIKFQLWFKGRRYENEDQSLSLQWVEDSRSDAELRQRRLRRIRGVHQMVNIQ
ncbi:hypothetical protein G7Y89_g9275 [Cudoniella acicularis]|uniref:Uncharacterized protein n=1 Tax=Cudoniella acicularis TaxID=354080 RepID=A0A8H4RGI5_9HELO|nr:hypothetical protein G7Y89_g9275 [Cudoniella acicularis]